VTAVPHVMRHLEDWVRDHPDTQGDRAFIRRVANEVLRLHPSSPAILREAKEQVTTSSGQTYEQGEGIAVLTATVNRDPEVFGADAEDFNPFRELPKEVAAWGFSFGGGAHLCIGRNLAAGFAAESEGGAGADGVMVDIVDQLMKAGAVGDGPAVDDQNSYIDSFGTYPVRLL
jgi:hypothetical protein